MYGKKGHIITKPLYANERSYSKTFWPSFFEWREAALKNTCFSPLIKKKMKTTFDLTNHSIEQTLFNVKLSNRPAYSFLIVPTPSIYNLSLDL